MRIPRLYTPNILEIGQVAELDDEASNYLGKALRMRAGDALRLFNGSGQEFSADIQEVSRRHVTVIVREAFSPQVESPLSIRLGLGVSKGDRMDIAIQKACELGVSEIHPLTTRYCDVRLDEDRAARRVAHWQKVAISASEQSGRVCVAQIHPIHPLETWVGSTQSDLKLVAHPGGETPLRALHTGPHTLSLLIGPEGGLHDLEVEQAVMHGFHRLALGPRILRTETAPLVAISLLQHVWGDFSTL
ncbi:MAG: 16S rRNA (uracil(1498)-N(3))-methyltransferase [Hahellaceae bacterium]|nr:16S rRNA (uracil(1498)-N(3))-methyltransferase [Hahellaceae bacterium]